MRFGLYVNYDSKRDRFVQMFEAASDDAAKNEFCFWYRAVVRPSRWEKRKLLRYALFLQAYVENRVTTWLDKPVFLMWDEDVRMSHSWFWMADPPANAVEDEALEAEFDRLNALDAARLARRDNQGV